MRDKDLLKLLMQNGRELVRIKVSHHVIQKDGQTEIMPVHNKDMPIGLLNAILKRTGLK